MGGRTTGQPPTGPNCGFDELTPQHLSAFLISQLSPNDSKWPYDSSHEAYLIPIFRALATRPKYRPRCMTEEQQPPVQPAAPPPPDPRRRLRELLSVPERDRSDAQWDEIIELEIQLAPGNRIGAPASGPGNRPQGQPAGGGQKPNQAKKNRSRWGSGRPNQPKK